MISYTLYSKEKFFTLLLFFITGLALFAFLGLGANFISPNAEFELNKRRVASISYADAITIGSSHNIAIMEDEFKYPLIHLYSAGQNFKESLFLLKYFKPRIKNVKFLLIPVSIGSLEQHSEVGNKIYEELTSLEPLNFFAFSVRHNPNAYAKGISTMVARGDNWIGVFRAITDYKIEKKPDINNGNPFATDRAMLHVNSFIVRSGQKNENVKDLSEIITISQELGSCLMLYESPVSYAYLEAFAKYRPELKQWKDKFRQIVAQSDKKHCIHFIEDTWPLEHSKNAAYYKDQDHLNDKGGHLFTAFINKKLDNLQTQIR